jgi:multidrug resistance efflux pump
MPIRPPYETEEERMRASMGQMSRQILVLSAQIAERDETIASLAAAIKRYEKQNDRRNEDLARNQDYIRFLLAVRDEWWKARAERIERTTEIGTERTRW